MSTTICTTVTLTDEMIKGLSLVGQTATYQGEPFKVHSVEGSNWNAQTEEDGTVTLDAGLTRNWITHPVAYVVGQSGRVRGVYLSDLVKV